MRKVKFNKWIQAVWPEKANSTNCTTSHKPIEGTNCWEKEFTNDGIFHQWANAYTEFESGAGNYTVALIELSDGTISEVLPINIKFVEPLVMS